MERAVLESLATTRQGRQHIIEILFIWPRQAGKNQVDAVWALRFLSYWGALAQMGRLPVRTIEAVRTAPTYQPGVAVSKRRLEQELERWRGISGQKWGKSEGYAYRIAGLMALLKLLSANESAQRRGETANGYLSVDECQLTNMDVYTRDLVPMCATTGAPRFLFGTQWDDQSLVNIKLQELTAAQDRDGYRRVYRVPWWDVAEYNPAYGYHVQRERDSLGPDHPVYRGEYLLLPLAGADAFVGPAGLALLQGAYKRPQAPLSGSVYVGGVDFCGADEEPDDEAAFDEGRAAKLDNTCAWVLEMSWREERDEHGAVVGHLPVFRTADVLYLPGQHPDTTVNKLEAFLFGKWKCQRVWLDGNGVGNGPSATLRKRREYAVEIYTATRAKNSRQGLRLKACIDTGRFQLFHEESPSRELILARKQFKHLRKKILGASQDGRSPGVMLWGHPERMVLDEGGKVVMHDDGPKAAALAVEAGYEHLAKRRPVDRKREHESWDDAAGYAA